MSKLIMMRHGESCWNKLNIFTGWVDVPLSAKGIEEALEGGRRISSYPIDLIFTSTLVRAQMTAFLAMSRHKTEKVPVVMHPEDAKLGQWGAIYDADAGQAVIPVVYAWELNERMYGELQGLNKAETMKKFGKEQVHLWRRSYDMPPPQGESLQMTADRTIPYFKNTIVPQLKKGNNVFISAHGNSLRSICMYLDNLSKEEVLKLEIATGLPILYTYSNDAFVKETL